ncbi:MAG: beta-galactosidase [Pseudobutyrivibrio sp.]|nr:beta-galactosidase [Pseudobutyrivibrio sp.]
MLYRFKEFIKEDIITGHLNLGGTDNVGNEIGVNSLYFTKNGKPVLPVMGEMHFSRVPREHWKRSLELMKAGGIDIVATYIIWIYHEPTEGQLDFTGNLDLREFVKLADEVGLKVCIRIGPWCHGEVRNGGFPDWILKKPFMLRTNDEQYLKQVRNWFSAIASQLFGLYFKDGGPVVMCQLENELTDNAEHLLTLKHIAIEEGIMVPIYTVTGWNAVNGAKIPVDDVVPTFGGYCDAPWDEGIEQLSPCARYYFTGIRNDSAIGKDLIKKVVGDDWQLPYKRYPYATCEIGGGLMNTYHRRYQIAGIDIYAMALIMLCEGANLLGYYMYHGGINMIQKNYTLQESKATGYPNDYPMISYDFQAPISSYGQARESYDLLNLLHLFIHEYGQRLAQMTYVESELSVEIGDMTSLRYGMRRDENSGFVFINHYQRLHAVDDVLNVEIDTGEVKFPIFDVKGDISFFMPFNMDMGNGVILKYATAQPLCKDGDCWLFMEIPGISPVFEFSGGKTCPVKVVNLDKAKRLRKVDGRVYFEDTCSLTLEDLMNAPQIGYKLSKLNAPKFEIPSKYMAELEYSHKNVEWYSLTLDEDCPEFINLNIKCDVMQLYVDGELVEDDFYHNQPWRLPKYLINGKAYIVISEYQDNGYME